MLALGALYIGHGADTIKPLLFTQVLPPDPTQPRSTSHRLEARHGRSDKRALIGRASAEACPQFMGPRICRTQGF